MNETINVEIECPKCGSTNAVPRPWELTCQACKSPLVAGRYSQRVMSAWTALFLGIGGTLGANQFINTDRYPMQVEHTIIEECINGSRKPMNSSYIVNKREVCICALSETQNDFNAKAFNDKKLRRKFIRVFEQNAQQCIND